MSTHDHVYVCKDCGAPLVPNFIPARVEQATAAPGEVRDVHHEED